jgi:hypothetical protein
VEYYSHSLELPFSKVNLIFRELKTKEQIFLAKSILTFSNKKEDFLNYHNFVFNLISNCVQNNNELKKIDVIEYVLFLVKFRMISAGSNIDFLLNIEEKGKTKLKVDLKTYLTNLYNASICIEENQFINDNDLEIKITWPKISSLFVFHQNLIKNLNDYDVIENTLYEFLDYIKFKNKKIILDNFTNDEKKLIFDKLSFSMKQKIKDLVLLNVSKLMDFDLFGIEYFKNYRFNVYNLSFLEHLKLFFSYDVRSLYQEIYILSGCGLSSDYLMNISPAERNIYFSIMQEQKNNQNKKSSPEENLQNQSLEDLALEFGDTMT